MNGVLIVDKPSGMTSRDVVNKVGRILNTKRIGHTGTLDPMATGVLILCVGKATKISELITSYNKEYIAEVTLGIETDTLDIEGNIINEVNDINVDKNQVEDVLDDLIGTCEQEVPKYSAIKINGRKLYDYARKNIEVELPKRSIEIYKLSMVSDLETIDNKITFKIDCLVSKGTYIRSLVRDIGLKLGYPACMSYLRRIKQGNFTINEAYTLEEIGNNDYKLINVDNVLSDIESITIDEETEKKVRNGALINKIFDGNMAKIINVSGELIAIYQTYEKDCTKAKPYKMMTEGD